MYKLDTLIFENGERYPILVGEDGMPHFYPTLYVTTKLRSSLAVNTISNRLKAILWFIEWEKKKNRCLATEFEKGQFLTVSDITDLREHLKINISDQKTNEQGKSRSTGRVVSFEDAPKILSTVASVGRNHHYNRMTSVAEYLHFVATITNQHRNSPTVTNAIDKMLKDFKKERPKGKGKNVSDKSDAHTLPDGLLDEFMEMAHPDHPLNPFSNIMVKKRNYLIFRLIRETGIRRGEALSIEITHLELYGEKASIWVRRKHDDKFDSRKRQPVSKTKERKLPIKKETAELLDNYIVHERANTPNANKHPYLFVTHRKCKTQGHPISVSYFDNEIISKMKAIDEKFSIIHAHIFRHEWNLDFSRKIDSTNAIRAIALAEGKSAKPLIEPEHEAKMRKHLMGHSSEGSGDVYNKRYIKEQANEVMLAEQKKLQDKLNKINKNKERK